MALGNRQCVTRVAIALAQKSSNFDQFAFDLMKNVTQCHPDGAAARARLDGAGAGAGCPTHSRVSNEWDRETRVNLVQSLQPVDFDFLV